MTQTLVHVHHLNLFHTSRLGVNPLKSAKADFTIRLGDVFLRKRRKERTVKLRLLMWGCSSVGRAPALQAGGQEFESPHLHHAPRKPKYSKINIWSSNKGHRANALAPGGDEGRDKHRYASGRRK